MKTMTQKALDANRSNAGKSTGPRSQEGKATVSKNRMLHGLRAWADVVPGEDATEYERLQADLVEELKPAGEIERALTARVGSCLWRLWRMQRIEAGYFAREKDGALTRIIKPKLSLDQQFKELTGEAPETPNTKVKEPETLESWGLAWVRMCNHGSNIIDKLGRYETGLERSLYKSLHELERLQRRRLGEAMPAPLAVDVSVDLARADGFER